MTGWQPYLRTYGHIAVIVNNDTRLLLNTDEQ